MSYAEFPRLIDIREAAIRIQPYIHRTPVLRSGSLDDMSGARLFFKCENLQKVGAFKFRGATNAVFSIGSKYAGSGVATHSSGNHAAALALAARNRGIPAYIVMPSNAPEVKKRAVAGYGAEITYCEPTLEARESTLKDVIARTGAHEIHPYNNWQIIAGQATAALELLDDVPDLDMILAPVGGGGLLSGTALSVAYLTSLTETIGVEPELADDAQRSFLSRQIIPSVNPKTIADGLLTSLGDKTFEVICEHVADIATVSEQAIISAMRHMWERMKLIIEPSSAVPLAAVLDRKIDVDGKRIGIILSGGNVDLDKLPWM